MVYEHITMDSGDHSRGGWTQLFSISSIPSLPYFSSISTHTLFLTPPPSPDGDSQLSPARTKLSELGEQVPSCAPTFIVTEILRNPVSHVLLTRVKRKLLSSPDDLL